MAPLPIYNYLEAKKLCSPINLFSTSARTSSSIASQQNGSSSSKQKGRLRLIIDSESCLDRLYGGFFSDWASGGQWNRMLNYIGNLARACKSNNLQIVVSIRGGVEKDHAETLFKSNRDFKDRLSRMMLHLQNRGTPPPKVWWLPPTCLREVISLSMLFYGIPVLSTIGDYYSDVISYMHANNADGILTDNLSFAFLNPSSRLFSAHAFKLTYKGSLETKEYFLNSMLSDSGINEDRYALLSTLLGNHIVSTEVLKEFYEQLVGDESSSKVAAGEEMELCMIGKLLGFVRDISDPTDVDGISERVFKSSTISVEEGADKLSQSIDYYKRIVSNTKVSHPKAISSEFDVLPVKSDPAEEKTEDCEKEGEDEGGVEKVSSTHEASSNAAQQSLVEDTANLTLSADSDKEVSKSTPSKIHIVLSPNEAIVKLAIDRHSKGLMSPIIAQSLIQREVRLPCYIEQTNMVSDGEDRKSIIEMYRPIRQSVYAILHNLSKHMYDNKQVAEEGGSTLLSNDIHLNIVEHYLGPLGAEVNFDLKVTPVQWPVPSVESLWLGVKPENKMRRMKAFLSCMQVGSNPYISNPNHVPERFLFICTVLRYLLKCEPAELTLSEVDAVLAMTTANILFDIQTMQDMQLPLITPRGVHVASVVMAGIQHAMLVNDACGAPLHVNNTFPWCYFDGKLLQYKLLKASTTIQLHRLDLCDGQMAQVIMMEKLRQAVLFGLEAKLGDKFPSMPFPLSSGLPGRIFPGHTAYLRPHLPSTGRGKNSLMGEFVPVNSRLDGRGGKLQVAGQVVATWGPRPGNKGGSQNRGSEFDSAADDQHGNSAQYSAGSRPHRNNSKKKHGYHNNRHNHGENKNKSQNANHNNSESNSKQSVVIATKDETKSKDNSVGKGEGAKANELSQVNGEAGVVEHNTESRIKSSSSA